VLHNGLAKRFDIRHGDLRDPEILKDELYDLITGNPPYFPQEQMMSDAVASHAQKQACVWGVCVCMCICVTPCVLHVRTCTWCVCVCVCVCSCVCVYLSRLKSGRIRVHMCICISYVSRSHRLADTSCGVTYATTVMPPPGTLRREGSLRWSFPFPLLFKCSECGLERRRQG
jgi:hypothetical protein